MQPKCMKIHLKMCAELLYSDKKPKKLEKPSNFIHTFASTLSRGLPPSIFSLSSFLLLSSSTAPFPPPEMQLNERGCKGWRGEEGWRGFREQSRRCLLKERKKARKSTADRNPHQRDSRRAVYHHWATNKQEHN